MARLKGTARRIVAVVPANAPGPSTPAASVKREQPEDHVQDDRPAKRAACRGLPPAATSSAALMPTAPAAAGRRAAAPGPQSTPQQGAPTQALLLPAVGPATPAATLALAGASSRQYEKPVQPSEWDKQRFRIDRPFAETLLAANGMAYPYGKGGNNTAKLEVQLVDSLSGQTYDAAQLQAYWYDYTQVSAPAQQRPRPRSGTAQVLLLTRGSGRCARRQARA